MNTVTKIILLFIMVGISVIVTITMPPPDARETDASGYKFAADLLNISCPNKATKLKELIDDDGILSGYDLDKFHRLCNQDRRDIIKKELMDNLHRNE